MDDHMEFPNISYGDYGMPSYTPGIQSDISVKITIAITAWIIFTNAAFIVTFVTSRSLRRKPGHWLLVNLACANTCVGLIVTPLAAYYEHSELWRLGTSVCIAWLFSDVFLACVSIIALMMINIDRLVFIRNPFSYDSEFRKATIFVMVALSWLGAATIVIPLFFIGHRDGFDTDIPDMCFMELSPEYAIGIAVGAYYIPAFIIVCLTFATLVAVSSAKTRLLDVTMVTHINGRTQYITRNTCLSIKSIATALVIVNSFFLTMWFPFYLFSTIISAGGFTLISPTAIGVSIWMCYINSGLNPVLWLLNPDIRRAFKRLLSCAKCRRKIISSEKVSKDSSEQTFMLNTTGYYD